MIIINSDKYIKTFTLMQKLDKSLYTYTALFCEENIYKLIESFINNKDPAKISHGLTIMPVDVLFIINASETVALYEQINSANNQPIIWDYHVVLTAMINQTPCVLDFDSHCNFPVTIEEYAYKTFPENTSLPQQLKPLLKAIPSDYYLKHFSSDRSHMRGIIPESEFPKYPAIQATSGKAALTLKQCRDIKYTPENMQLYTPFDYLRKQLK